MKNKTILVDCFGTIILRNVPANVVLKLWTDKLANEFNLKPKKMYKQYMNQFTKDSIKLIFTKYALEANMDNVLKKMANKLFKRKKIIDIEAFTKRGIQLYVNTEMEHQYLNTTLVNKLRNEKENGAKVYMVSDFHCSKYIFEQWLSKLEALNVFEEIYSSSEYNKDKATGKMYKFLKNELNLKEREVTMIGDNSWSDIHMAKKNGFKTQKITNKDKFVTYPELDNLFQENGDEYVLSNYAFPLYLFTKRLYNELEKNGNKDVCFLAREGQFMKKLFDRYNEILHEDKKETIIKSHYFYASRNSALSASMGDLSKEDFFYLFRYIKFMSSRKFLVSIGFTKNEIEEVENNSKLKLDKFHLLYSKSSSFRKLKKNKTFQDLYNKKRNEQSAAFEEYLKSFNVDFRKDGIVLVDIGYHGTMQDIIHKILGENVQTDGYFITCRVPDESKTNTKQGLLYDMHNNKMPYQKILKFGGFIYEQILKANHGRTTGYTIDADGIGQAVLDDKLKDKEVFDKYVSIIQDQILEKFDKLARLDILNNYDLDKLAVIYYYKMIKNKSAKDWEIMESIQDYHHDDFGMVGYSYKAVSKKLVHNSFKFAENKYVFDNKRKVKKIRKQLLVK